MLTENIFNNKNEGKCKRAWSKYSNSLIKGNRIFGFFHRNKSLERENNGKIDRPYEYPLEFFIYLAKIRSLWNAPFHVLEAFVRKFSKIT